MDSFYDVLLMIYRPAVGPPVTTIKTNLQNLNIDTTVTYVAVSNSINLRVSMQHKSKDNDFSQL